MSLANALPSPQPLDIHGRGAAESWEEFEQAWEHYSSALKIDKEEESVRVSALLTVIGQEARKVFKTFEFAEGDAQKIEPVLKKITVSRRATFRLNDTNSLCGCRKVASQLITTSRI